MPSGEGIIDFLYGLERHGIKPGLERVHSLLAALGNPQDSFRSIHVAGTNGKGSVCSMAASILNEAGFKTGLYTSPHLVKFNERISISGKNISENELIKAAREVKAASEKAGVSGTITFFEFTTAMAFLHFRKKKVEFAVVETGMGGRLDATNLTIPAVSVITNIALDHTAWLGSTIKEIAGEKAGIIKPGVPVVTGAALSALSVIKAAAKKAPSPVYVMGRDFHAEGECASFSYSGLSGGLTGVKLSLNGGHQVQNAALAIAAIEVLRAQGVNITGLAIRKGLNDARWPGRFEILSRRPLVVLDGAHNPNGAASLKNALSSLKKKRLMLVIGIMSDKDMDGILKELVPASDLVIATKPKGERSATLPALIQAASRYGKPVNSVKSVKDACKKALSLASPTDCVCVSGSLFTVGEARRYLLRALARKTALPCK